MLSRLSNPICVVISRIYEGLLATIIQVINDVVLNLIFVDKVTDSFTFNQNGKNSIFLYSKFISYHFLR